MFADDIKLFRFAAGIDGYAGGAVVHYAFPQYI